MKFSVTVDGEKNITHDKAEINLYLSTNSILQKENFILKRLTTLKKIQTVNNCRPTNKKKRKHTHSMTLKSKNDQQILFIDNSQHQ